MINLIDLKTCQHYPLQFLKIVNFLKFLLQNKLNIGLFVHFRGNLGDFKNYCKKNRQHFLLYEVNKYSKC